MIYVPENVKTSKNNTTNTRNATLIYLTGPAPVENGGNFSPVLNKTHPLGGGKPDLCAVAELGLVLLYPI